MIKGAGRRFLSLSARILPNTRRGNCVAADIKHVLHTAQLHAVKDHRLGGELCFVYTQPIAHARLPAVIPLRKSGVREVSPEVTLKLPGARDLQHTALASDFNILAVLRAVCGKVFNVLYCHAIACFILAQAFAGAAAISSAELFTFSGAH